MNKREQIDYQELKAAKRLLQRAQLFALDNDSCMGPDYEAVTAAILMRALELATPELSRDRRASLFNGDDE
jgi:hypothetical protein